MPLSDYNTKCLSDVFALKALGEPGIARQMVVVVQVNSKSATEALHQLCALPHDESGADGDTHAEASQLLTTVVDGMNTLPPDAAVRALSALLQLRMTAPHMLLPLMQNIRTNLPAWDVTPPQAAHVSRCLSQVAHVVGRPARGLTVDAYARELPGSEQALQELRGCCGQACCC